MIQQKTQTNNKEPAESVDNAIPPTLSECTRLLTDQNQQGISKSDQEKAGTTMISTWATKEKLTVKRLEAFAKEILPTSVQVQLSQPFGKECRYNHTII